MDVADRREPHHPRRQFPTLTHPEPADDRTTFLKVARRELGFQRLAAVDAPPAAPLAAAHDGHAPPNGAPVTAAARTLPTPPTDYDERGPSSPSP